MTHSTRKSYKDKLAKLQADRDYDVDKAVKTLGTQADANGSFVEFQTEVHNLAIRIATSAKLASELVDKYAYCEGMTFPKIRREVDSVLENMNVNIMLRRADDILKKLVDRVALLSEAYNDTRRGLDTVLTQTRLLERPLDAIKAQAFETAIVGRAASDAEKAQAETDGQFSRYNLDYETECTDDEDSDNESDIEPNQGSYALALRN